MVFAFLGDIGGGELMLILVFVLIFFGANKIPELARGLGRGMREFREATNNIRAEIENAGQVPATRPVSSATVPTPADALHSSDAPAEATVAASAGPVSHVVSVPVGGASAPLDQASA